MIDKFLYKSLNKPLLYTRNFFHFITLSFNQVDEERRKLVGPDRTCAEWVLKNGGGIRWVGDQQFIDDYNALPSEKTQKYIEAIDGTNSSISHHGFPHLIGCNNIREIVFKNCTYLEDEAMAKLEPLKSSLVTLVIVDCPNLTLKGLAHLTKQKKLKKLVLKDFAYIPDRDLQSFLRETKIALPNCKIN